MDEGWASMCQQAPNRRTQESGLHANLTLHTAGRRKMTKGSGEGGPRRRPVRVPTRPEGGQWGCRPEKTSEKWNPERDVIRKRVWRAVRRVVRCRQQAEELRRGIGGSEGRQCGCDLGVHIVPDTFATALLHPPTAHSPHSLRRDLLLTNTSFNVTHNSLLHIIHSYTPFAVTHHSLLHTVHCYTPLTVTLRSLFTAHTVHRSTRCPLATQATLTSTLR